MREYKAKRLDGTGWVYGLPKRKKLWTVEYGFFECKPGDNIHIDPETVSQYTGLDDINSLKLFENDIVSIVDKTKGNLIVTWEKETAGYYLLCVDGESSEFIDDVESTIIGNIFDNLELLEV